MQTKTSVHTQLSRISDNRQTIRTCIFILSQIPILTKSEYATEIVGICFILSIILCFSQIYCYRHGDDKKRSYIEAIKKSLYGIYFAGMMLIIWILVMISIP